MVKTPIDGLSFFNVYVLPIFVLVITIGYQEWATRKARKNALIESLFKELLTIELPKATNAFLLHPDAMRFLELKRLWQSIRKAYSIFRITNLEFYKELHDIYQSVEEEILKLYYLAKDNPDIAHEKLCEIESMKTRVSEKTRAFYEKIYKNDFKHFE